MNEELENKINKYYSEAMPVRNQLVYKYNTSKPEESEEYSIHISFEENEENTPTTDKIHILMDVNNQEKYLEIKSINLYEKSGNGLGRKLIEITEKLASELGSEKIRLLSTEEAKPKWESFGYEQKGDYHIKQFNRNV